MLGPLKWLYMSLFFLYESLIYGVSVAASVADDGLLMSLVCTVLVMPG